MKTAEVIGKALTGLAACLALNAFSEGPAITDVKVRQRWPWSRLVDINYVLECGDTNSVCVTVTGYSGATRLNLPLASLSGDLFSVSGGVRRIVWDPMKTGYTNEIMPWFRVELTPTDVPLYMIVNLTADAGATNQIEYVYEAELVTNKWGSWARNPVTNNGIPVASVIWTGVTNDPIYKTDKLVLRRVPAGTFMMGAGSGTKAIKLTKDYYASVFELTRMQWYRVAGGTAPAVADQGKPQGAVSYYDLREDPGNADDPDINWPATGYTVAPDSFMGKLRDKVGIGGFDLPTEAQWEYLCRAGTTTDFNSGEMWSADYTNTVNQLAWWKVNGGSTLHTVGEKRPNAWGLYDTHGNVWEWCLDWYTNALVAATDPAGPGTSSEVPPTRVRRGGGPWDDAFWQQSGSLTKDGRPDARIADRGIRLVWTLP